MEELSDEVKKYIDERIYLIKKEIKDHITDHLLTSDTFRKKDLECFKDQLLLLYQRWLETDCPRLMLKEIDEIRAKLNSKMYDVISLRNDLEKFQEWFEEMPRSD
uniref:Uncharacterized protein n=1 Tax=uncultured Caudovirales phage TaxID=2100421 RepID=A0A6J5KV54_9CAUD|nr:hypothetical protein UFOVP88_27 [uncultured Caudovirales phage]